MQVADGLLDSLICIEIDRSCFEIELELAFENVTHFRHFLPVASSRMRILLLRTRALAKLTSCR